MSLPESDRLDELARLLGCSPNAFIDDERMPGHLRETAEMFRLWFELGPSEDRTRLLALARNLAGNRAGTKAQRNAGRYK